MISTPSSSTTDGRSSSSASASMRTRRSRPGRASSAARCCSPATRPRWSASSTAPCVGRSTTARYSSIDSAGKIVKRMQPFNELAQSSYDELEEAVTPHAPAGRPRRNSRPAISRSPAPTTRSAPAGRDAPRRALRSGRRRCGSRPVTTAAMRRAPDQDAASACISSRSARRRIPCAPPPSPRCAPPDCIVAGGVIAGPERCARRHTALASRCVGDHPMPGRAVVRRGATARRDRGGRSPSRTISRSCC